MNKTFCDKCENQNSSEVNFEWNAEFKNLKKAADKVCKAYWDFDRSMKAEIQELEKHLKSEDGKTSESRSAIAP